MKKYLMTGIAALALCAGFTSCSSHDMEEATPENLAKLEEMKIRNNYEKAFVATFGQPAANQEWGFGSLPKAARTRTGNTGPDAKATSGNINANANEWADVSNNTSFGGWNVPDALTKEQKERVIAYFQANPNLDYKDPHYKHFFVQQVYKGNTAQAGASSETITDVNGVSYDSNNMNELSVGQTNIHINNFNRGTYSATGDNANPDGSVNVLNNGANIANNTGIAYHTDQIMLMVNIDDTSCFGYKDSATGGTQHNNKMALVSAAKIDEWASTHGNPGAAVSTDKWERSFMGFDLALLEGEQVYAKNSDGSNILADYSQAPGQPIYAWDGTNIIEMKNKVSTDQWGNITWGDFKDEYKNIMKGTEAIGWLNTDANFYTSAGSVNLTQTYSNGELQVSALSSIEGLSNYVVIDNVWVTENGKAKVLNLKRIQELVGDGYLPIYNTSLQNWVQVGKSDGYFTDWIVTLTKAEKVDVPDDPYPGVTSLRIMAEDLSASEASDFDFNDVVFDVVWKSDSEAEIILQAAGGTLPLTVNGVEVHGAFEVETNVMVNTNWTGTNTAEHAPVSLGTVSGDFTEANFCKSARNIKIMVQKGEAWYELTANKGEACCKFGISTKEPWVDERTPIENVYNFGDWVKGFITTLTRK